MVAATSVNGRERFWQAPKPTCLYLFGSSAVPLLKVGYTKNLSTRAHQHVATAALICQKDSALREFLLLPEFSGSFGYLIAEKVSGSFFLGELESFEFSMAKRLDSLGFSKIQGKKEWFSAPCEEHSLARDVIRLYLGGLQLW